MSSDICNKGDIKLEMDDVDATQADDCIGDYITGGGNNDINKQDDPGDDHEEEYEEDDVIELDENGCVRDFNLIADALEGRRGANKTFNDFELRDIERKNSILMNKILSHTKRQSQYKVDPIYHKVSNSSVNRKKQQQKIERENLILLRKIQSVKSFGVSKPKKK